MAPRPTTRNDPSRVHERPPDPAEAAGAALTNDPRLRRGNPVREPDPTADSDPYEREDDQLHAQVRLEGRRRMGAASAARGDPGDSPEQRGLLIDPDADPDNIKSGPDDVRPPADS